jgi:hypothetical protein
MRRFTTFSTSSLALLRSAAVDLNSARFLRRARILIPILFGCVSVCLGQDTNWDLFNYHLYNAFALLNGKLHVDLAPAGFQSFFNPLLDVPYYFAQLYLPAPLIGFAIGWVHGLSFVLLLAIAQQTLPTLPDRDRFRIPLLIAFTGCLTANYLSALGNTMGDNTTALLTLASLFLILKCWDELCSVSGFGIGMAVAAGILAGLSTGLKLTNSVYAVAMCAALLGCPTTFWNRGRLIASFAFGTLLGIALTGGYWLLEMWRTFGNPFFPQFGNYFPSPLAAGIGAADSSWRPRGFVETLLWPFYFSVDSLRVGQLKLHQIIWPITYVLFGWWLVSSIRGVAGRRSSRSLDPRARYLLTFLALGYLGWMLVFGVYRYIVTIELIAPLAVFLLFSQVIGYPKARQVAAWTLAVMTLVVLLGGVRTWGHEDWAVRAFRADLPVLPDPQHTTALVVAEDPPYAWLATLFPPEIAFVGVGGGPIFDTPTYLARVKQTVETRGGPAFAVAEGHYNGREESINRANAIIAELGLLSGERRCELLRSIVSILHFRAAVANVGASVGSARCRLTILLSDYRDVQALNRRSAEKVGATLERYGFSVDPNLCTLHYAYAGSNRRGYQWCPVVGSLQLR